MNTLYWLITITDRHSTDAFLALYEEHGITVSLRTVGAGTAVRETLSTLGLEQTEKAVLFAMITAETWPGLQKDLRRKMRIDVPGTGIAFIIPVSSIGGKRALQFLTEHQTFALKEESTLKDTPAPSWTRPAPPELAAAPSSTQRAPAWRVPPTLWGWSWSTRRSWCSSCPAPP